MVNNVETKEGEAIDEEAPNKILENAPIEFIKALEEIPNDPQIE